MNPKEGQFNEGWEKANNALTDAIKLMRGHAEIFGNESLTSEQKDEAIKKLNESVRGEKKDES
jgi:hypothetical protein